jgi:NAD(P)-dependent dehydrogenase (short-subunit alcohol dehydrogenase family)
LTAPYAVCRAALPHLRAAASATIVNFASSQALMPEPGACAYVTGTILPIDGGRTLY